MMTSDELDMEYELRRRNNPDESESTSRKEIYKQAMLDALNEAREEADEAEARRMPFEHLATARIALLRKEVR